jgi:hypothetical protein
LIASLSGFMAAVVLGIGGGIVGFLAGVLWWFFCGLSSANVSRQPDEHAKWVASHFLETIALFTLIPAGVGAILGGVVLPLLIMLIGLVWKACRHPTANE